MTKEFAMHCSFKTLTLTVFTIAAASPCLGQDFSPPVAAAPLPRHGGQAGVYRLMFDAEEFQGQGIRVLRVNQAGPATRLRKLDGSKTRFTMVSGDVVIGVDGKRIRSLADYHQAMNHSDGGPVFLTIWDAHTHETGHYVAQPMHFLR
jgi:S1-C subfamily serine protease